jgi:hypothetical protein
MFTYPTVADFKDFFVRDFPFQPNPIPTPPDVVEPDKYIQDSDITRAQLQAKSMCNQNLFSDQGMFNLGYELLSAHYLVVNIRASSSGLNGKFEWPAGSKSVGSVSISQSIPQSILNNPMYAWLTTTNYGAEYLMMIWPLLTGVMFTSPGGTHA